MGEMSEKRKVVLGITGSIAAYKSAELTRYFVTRGYDVHAVLTESAAKFITPLTFETLTGRPVTTSFWDETRPGAIGHIAVADWAEVLLIAPASADFIAKLAHGCADSPLLAIALATKAPIVVAPAMNVNMLSHPATQDNMATLRKRGVLFVDAEDGDLACGWRGRGRLASHREIFFNVRRALSPHDLQGRRILITAGPTREPIDPVRFISNRSSGKMGAALATEAFRRGAEVTVVHGPIAGSLKVPDGVKCRPVVSAAHMQEEVISLAFPQVSNKESPPFDVVIMAAAVADYRPTTTASKKIKKATSPTSIPVTANPDILADLGERKKDSRLPLLVGFAVETGDEQALMTEVRRKLSQKNADLMIGNLAEEALDLDTNRVWLVDKNGKEEEVAANYKSRIAVRIFDAISKLY